MTKKFGKSLTGIILTLAMVLSLMPAMTVPASAAAGDTWTVQISGVSANLKGVCYGGSTFVAVGAGGTIITSSNGTSWTNQTSANSSVTADADLNAVCYGNGMFMAVGAGGLVITSADGATWTAHTNTITSNLVAVAYGLCGSSNTFVAADDSYGKLFTSTNGGTTWSMTFTCDISLYGICYGNGQFVAVGGTNWETSKVLISTDGNTWEDHSTDQADQDLTSVCYGNGLYVACDIQSRVLTSADGASWINRDWQDLSGYHSFDAVCYGGTTFAAVGGSGILYISTDGTTWSAKTSGTSNYLRGICYGNGSFVAVGDSGTVTASVGTVKPTVTGISQASGSTVGGTSVVITGTNFMGVTAVSFGPTNATSYMVTSATQIVATSPAGNAGTVDITVTTGGGTSVTSAADQFTYVAPNAAPTDIALSASSINENVAGNTTVGTLSSTDPDSGNTFTYSLVDGDGSGDNASFNIDGSSLRISNIPNYEAKSSYSVRIRTTDQGGLWYEEAFTITINDLNDAPFTRDVTSFLQLGAGATAMTAGGTYATDEIDNITLEAWIYLENIAPTDTHAVLFNGNGGSSGYGIYLGYPSGATVSVLLGGVGWIHCSGGTSYSAAKNAVLTAKQWTHIAVTRKTGEGTDGWKIYINGQPMATYFEPTPGPTATPKSMDGNSNVQIGGGSAGLSVSEARIWNRALTQSEIQANMSGAVAVNATDLVGYWKLNDGSGTTANDIQTNQTALNLPITGSVTWVASTAGITAEDTAISGRLAGGDIETAVTYAKASDPAHGTVSVGTDGTYTYTPTADYYGSDSFTFVTNDGSADSAGRTVNITVTPVNDAPTLTTSGGTTAFTEGADTNSTPVAIDSGITLTDPDNTTLSNTVISITGNFQSGQDVLAFSNTNASTFGNISASYNAGTGVLTMTSLYASATIAQWQSALRAVTYTNNSDTPNTSTRTISFAANDGMTAGTAATKSISVSASNDAPILTPGVGTPTYTENAAGVAVDSGITISDPDSSTLASATVSISAGFQAGKDVLAFENGDASTYGNISVDSYNAITGILTLTSVGTTATTAQWQAALGAVKFSSTSDNPGTTRTVSFKIKDGGNAESAAVTKDIAVTPVNDTPTDIALSYTSVAENAVSGTTIGTLSTADPDGDVSFTYSIQSVKDKNNNVVNLDTFAISGSALCTNAALSYSTNNSYTVTVRTSDGGSLTYDKTFTITVTEVNVAPNNIALSKTSVEENKGANFEVATLTASDPNLSDTTFTYALVTGTGSTDNGSFNILGDKLRFTSSADYEAKDKYYIRVKVTDIGGLNFEKAFEIDVTNVNEAPVVTASVGTTAFSETATGTSTPVVVDGNITVTDVDSGTILTSVTATISSNYNSTQDELSFTNDGSTMGNIAASFSSGILTLNSEGGTATVAQWQAALQAVKYTNTSHNPTTATRTITFSVSDGALSAVATKDITITQANSAPTGIVLTNNTVAENKEVGEPVGTLSATDADADDTVTFSLVSGYGDNASFTIESVSGSYALKLAVSPNYEVKNSYSIRIRATDIAGATYDKDFTIMITDANDAPSITSDATANFAENGTGTVYTATRTDPDTGDTVAWSLDGADKALFSIDSDGKVTFNSAPNYEDKKDAGADNVYNITVIATDSGSLTASKDVAITVTNVNEAPAISTAATLSITEGSTTAFTAAATDPDGNAVTWSITGGADAGKFSIVPGTGVVTFTTPPSYRTPADADAHNDYVLEITASDGTLSVVKTVTVSVAQQVSGGGGSTTTGTTNTVVEINGQKQDAGKSETSTNSSGQTTTTVKVDDTKLDKLIENSGEKPTVTLPSTGSDVTVGELNGQTVKNMEVKEATLEIKTETATYTLPASQINIDAVSGQLGEQVALKDIKVSVKIAEPTADAMKIAEDTATKGNYQLVVKPVEFEITCTSGDKTIEVNKFNGYVKRTIAIPDGVDPSKITTGIVVNADGSFRHVPTEIVIIDSKYYAKINSLTNSTYSVIYNPVEFTDVATHWAKTAINDMGSRMVVTGVGSNTYEPDRNITRAEFAAIIVRGLGLAQSTAESAFGDVSLMDWFNGYVDTATSYSLIAGYDKVSFAPNNTITREQAMTILARAMKLTGLNSSLTKSEVSALLARYTDDELISDYAKASVAVCIKVGVVSGTTTTRISPKDSVTRAEVAVMVQRLLQKSELI